MRSDLGALNLVKLMSGQSALEKWAMSMEQMCMVQSRHTPVRCRGRKICGWLSRKVRSVIQDKQKALIKDKITGSECDSHRYRMKQRLLNKITQEAKREYEKDVAKNIKHKQRPVEIPHNLKCDFKTNSTPQPPFFLSVSLSLLHPLNNCPF